MAKRTAVVLCVVVAVGCIDSELDGPQRSEFDGVDTMIADVERADMTIFGSRHAQSVIIDRWSGGDGAFDVLDERKTGRELFVDARCGAEQSCQVRYDAAVERTTDVEAAFGEGTLRIFRLGGQLSVEVGDGRVVGRSLRSDIADVSVEKGTARLSFDTAPEMLRIDLGDEATARVSLPEEAYRCNFDDDAESVPTGGLECDRHVARRIEVRPSDAAVHFEVRGDAR